MLLNKRFDDLSVTVLPVVSQDALAEEKEEPAAEAEQENQEASLHIIHVHCVVDDFNDRRLLRTSVLGRHVFFDPPLNQAHLVESRDFRVEKIQVWRVFGQHHSDLFFHELFVAQGEIAGVGLQVLASHDIQKVRTPVDIHIFTLPDL